MKFSVGDRIRVISNGSLGKIIATDFDITTRQPEYVVLWESGKTNQYPTDDCDRIWELDPQAPLPQGWGATQGWHGTDFSLMGKEDKGGKQAACNYFDHEWVDVGFSFTKLVCKKCNVDKP
jgi:hypothetical protein